MTRDQAGHQSDERAFLARSAALHRFKLAYFRGLEPEGADEDRLTAAGLVGAHSRGMSGTYR